MSKKAIVAVSFGTSYEEAEKAIINIEEKIKADFAEYDFYRAFTSGMIINKLKKAKGITILNPEELMIKLQEEGYEEIICQPTHIINGEEYDKMCHMIEKTKQDQVTVKVGYPLLTEESDFMECADILKEYYPKMSKEEAFVFMGHGSVHFANSAYCQMENIFRYIGEENIYVGTVEGFPQLDYVMKRMAKKQIKKVYLAPMMVVAGDHATNDLAGEEEDSWNSILKAAGYETVVYKQGMGSIDKIAELFVKHAKNAREF